MYDFSKTPDGLQLEILERKGCPIHYWLGGPPDRPLVALMHGATMDHRMFNAQVEALIADYRTLVWDARGHGKSQPIGSAFSLEICAQDMLAILDYLGADQAVICGQSLGGYIAQHIYFQAPERVQALAIIGSTPLTKSYSKIDLWALKASLPLIGMWPYSHFTRTIALSTSSTPAAQSYALQACRQIPREDFLTIWKAVTLAIDACGKPGFNFEVPLLLIHGQNDNAGTIKRDMPVWARSEPSATYHVIPNASHNANQDNPEFTNRVLLDFLRGHVKSNDQQPQAGKIQ